MKTLTRSLCGRKTDKRGPHGHLKTLAIISLIIAQNVAFAGSPTVVLFVIDGLQSDAALVAMANGAVNMKFLFDSGVWVKEAYCTSPAGRVVLPDGTEPWGGASPPNVAMHTGTHVFESKQIDDVFLAARRIGIASVFAASGDNYGVLSTADYRYTVSNSDSLVVQFAIEHVKKDGARLLSIHLQELRRQWRGPQEKLRPGSPYQRAILTADRLLGQLVEALKAEGVWDSTSIIVTADHGMGITARSDHPAPIISSWMPYMNFYGPDIKNGKTIPYAETPDIALLICRLLDLPPLEGHTDPLAIFLPKGTTGTLLTNLFTGNPDEISHPRLIRRYLEGKEWKAADGYAEYRSAMISLLRGEEQD